MSIPIGGAGGPPPFRPSEEDHAKQIATKYSECPYIVDPSETSGLPTLRDKMQDPSIDPQKLGILLMEGFVAAARGLEEMHKRGDVHRDVKLEHIVCTPDGACKLSGLDTVVDKETAANETKFTGTEGLLAREARDTFARDAKNDIYALGASFGEAILLDQNFIRKGCFKHYQLAQILGLTKNCTNSILRERHTAKRAADFVETFILPKIKTYTHRPVEGPTGRTASKIEKTIAPTAPDPIARSMLTRGVELRPQKDEMQTGATTKSYCLLQGDNVANAVFAKLNTNLKATHEEVSLLQNVLGRGLRQQDCDSIIQHKQMLLDAKSQIPDDTDVLEIKMRRTSCPRSMFIVKETGEIIIRGKTKQEGGSFKTFRKVLIFSPDKPPYSAAEFRLQKKRRRISMRHEELIKAERVAQKYKECPYIVSPAMYALKKSKEYGDKYSFVVEGADFDCPDLIEKAMREAESPTKTGLKEVLTGLLAGAKGLAELHKNGDVHRDFKMDNILHMSDGTYKLADVDTVISTKEIKQMNLPRYQALNIGTRNYYSPSLEQGNKHRKADDIFALGKSINLIVNEFRKKNPSLFSHLTSSALNTLISDCTRGSSPIKAPQVVERLEAIIAAL